MKNTTLTIFIAVLLTVALPHNVTARSNFFTAPPDGSLRHVTLVMGLRRPAPVVILMVRILIKTRTI